MEKTSRNTLDVLRSDPNMARVADQLASSFSEGIASGAKDIGQPRQHDVIEAMDLSLHEKKKREKYETSRPYEEHEKITLIKFALNEVFVTLPSMQVATEITLKELGTDAAAIEFLPPDDEELLREVNVQRFERDDGKRIQDLKQRLSRFLESLST